MRRNFQFKSADRCLSFFKTIKTSKRFEWTKECEEAFQELKKYLASLPTLATPKKHAPIHVYLASTDDAVNSALVLEKGEDQKPIYSPEKLSQSINALPSTRKASFLPSIDNKEAKTILPTIPVGGATKHCG